MENFKGNYQKSTCYVCNTEIIISVENIDDCDKITGSQAFRKYKSGFDAGRYVKLVGKYICKNCSKIESEKTESRDRPLAASKISKYIVQVFKCPICKEEFKTKQEVKDHILSNNTSYSHDSYHLEEFLKLKEKYKNDF